MVKIKNDIAKYELKTTLLFEWQWSHKPYWLLLESLIIMEHQTRQPHVGLQNTVFQPLRK